MTTSQMPTDIDWTPTARAITSERGWYQDTDDYTYIAEGTVSVFPGSQYLAGARTLVAELPVTDWNGDLAAHKGQRVRVVARVAAGSAEFAPDVVSVLPVEG